MRIAIIHSAYSRSSPSGENIVVESHLKSLRKYGFTVEKFIVESDLEIKSRLDTLSTAINVSLSRGKSPVEFLTFFQPDITFVHNLFPNIGDNWMRKWNGPIFKFLHNYRMFCANGVFFRDGKDCFDCLNLSTLESLKNGCYRNSALATLPIYISIKLNQQKNIYKDNVQFLALSKKSRDISIMAGIDATKIHVLPNFLEDQFEDRGSENENNLESWVVSGRLTEGKGMSELLREWPSEKRLTIFGNGPLEEYLRNQYSANKNIKFMGYVNNEIYLSTLNVFTGAILPSNSSEPHPLSFIEYAMMGKPILCHSNNSMADYVLKYNNGNTFNFENDCNLLNKTNELANNKREFSSNSRKLYLEEFAEEVWIKRLESLIYKYK